MFPKDEAKATGITDYLREYATRHAASTFTSRSVWHRTCFTLLPASVREWSPVVKYAPGTMPRLQQLSALIGYRVLGHTPVDLSHSHLF